MWLNNTVSRRKRYRVYLRLYLPRPLHSTSPRPRPTRPRVPASHTSRVPYQMSPRPSPRVSKSQVPTHASQCPRPLVPVPLLYTAIFSYYFADKYQCQELKEKSHETINSHFSVVMETDDFLNLDVKQVMRCEDVIFRAEEEIFQGILKWVCHKNSEREINLNYCVKFACIPCHMNLYSMNLLMKS